MMIFKKLTVILTSLALAFSAVPFSTYAAEATVEIGAIQETTVGAVSYRYFKSIDEAGDFVRDALKKHTSELHIRIEKEAGVKDILNDVLSAAFSETGKPDEGEFLRLSVEGYKASIGSIDRDPCMDITFSYNATIEQDKAAIEKAEEILSELISDGMSEYEKIDAVYQYLITHVVYSEEECDEIYTAYGALIDNDAVCQGFVQAMYYMLTDSGVSCRAVMGEGNGGDHVWLIAGIDGVYYYLDPTWDSEFNGEKRLFFLKGIKDFDEYSKPIVHIPGKGEPRNIAFIPDCTVESFMPDYPISEYKYKLSEKYITGDVNNDKCIDVFDLIAVKKGLIGGFGSKTAEEAADADGSGDVSVNDAVLIQKYIHGTLKSFSKVS